MLENLAANEALNSVPEESGENCRDSQTGKNYTYRQLRDAYQKATNAEDRKAAIQKIKTCSALRVIPDALPAFKNEEALLASINQLFNLSGWTPESLSPSGSNETSAVASNLNAIGVNISVEADTNITMNVLNNLERSIREFDISRATIEWSDKGLTLQARANAYYMTPSTITESTQTITAGGK